MTKYRKKPVVVEAFELGNDDIPNWFFSKQFEDDDYRVEIGKWACIIHETWGTKRVNNGEMIIKGTHGEIYSCKKEIFEATHDPVDEK